MRHGAWILLGIAAGISACSTIFGDVVFVSTGAGGAKGMGGGKQETGGAVGSGGAEADGGCTGGSGGSAPFVCNAKTVCWDLLWGGGATSRALAVAIDTAGGSYVVGQFSGTMKLDCAHTSTGDGAGDGFLVALTPSGMVSWVQTISGPMAQTVSAVAVDGMGNVIVGGYTQSSVAVANLSVSPGLFAAQFKSDGTPVWVTSLGGSDGSTVDDISTEQNGNADLCGRFVGTINLGSGPEMNPGMAEAWTGPLQSSDGLALGGGAWGTGLNGQVLNLGGVRWDSSGYKYIAGTFQGMIAPGGQGPLTASGNSDVFVVKYYNNKPDVLSQAQMGGTGDKTLTTLAVTPSGNVVLGGQYTGTFTLAGTTYMAPAGGTAFFTTMFSGPNPWAVSFGNGAGEIHASLDQTGQISLAGGFVGTINIGGVQVSTPSMNQNIFAAKLDPMFGALIWLRSFADSSASVAHGVAATPFGDATVAGEVSGSISLVDGGTETVTGTDVFVVELGQ